MGGNDRKPKIRQLRRQGDTEGLKQALAWRDWASSRDGQVDVGVGLRRDAVRALASLGQSEASLDAYEIALGDPHETVRLLAVDQLRAAGPPGLEILALAAGAWPPDRYGIAHERIIGALEQDDAVLGVREYARAAVAIDAPLDPRTAASLERLTEAAVDTSGWAAVLVEVLESDVGRERVEVLLKLALAGTGASLTESLDDPRRRAGALLGLGLTRDATAIAPISQHLDDPDPQVRRQAVIALGRIKHPSSVADLFAASQDSIYSVREAAMRALDGFGTVALAAAVIAAQPSGAAGALAEGTPVAPEPRQLETSSASGSDWPGPRARWFTGFSKFAGTVSRRGSRRLPPGWPTNRKAR